LTERKHVHNLGLTYSKYKSLKSPQKQALQLNTNDDDNSITATKLECVIA